MIEYYNHIKAIHIIFVTSWFAGLFYLPRLLVYHIEANEKPELERDILQKEYKRMQKILFNAIMIPAMWLTVISGILSAAAGLVWYVRERKTENG